MLKEIRAANNSNAARASVEFDHALMGHVVFSIGNGMRSWLHGLTGGYLASAPGSVGPEVQGYYSQLTRFSAAFALLADISLLVLGGSLKRKEKLSARLGDILSMLYLCSATLKRFKDDDRPAADLPLLHWSIQDALYRMQQAFDGLLDNFPGRAVGVRVLRFLVFPLGKSFSPPSDELGHKVAKLMLAPGEARDRLTAGIYIPTSADEPLGVLEQALQCAVVSEAVETKLRAAVKAGRIPAQHDEKIAAALKQRVITTTELELMGKMESLRRRVIMVDDFPPDFGRGLQAKPEPTKITRDVEQSAAEFIAIESDKSTQG